MRRLMPSPEIDDTNPQRLTDTPMLSVDGVEIELNMPLYRGTYSGGNYFRAECKFEVEAVRVMYIANQHRQFRTRSTEGCEEVHKAMECAPCQLFAKLDNLKEKMRKNFEHDMEKCKAKRAETQATEIKIRDEWMKLKTLDESSVRIPKKIKTK